MTSPTSQQVYIGVINHDPAIIKLLTATVYNDVEEKAKWWCKKENLLRRMSERYIGRRIIFFKDFLLRQRKVIADLTRPRILSFFVKDFYDNLFQVDITYAYLFDVGKRSVKYQFYIKPEPRDKNEIVEDITSVSLNEDFYYKNIKENPDDQEKCSLRLYYTILRNNTNDYIRVNYGIKKKDLDYNITSMNDEIKKYRFKDSIEKIRDISNSVPNKIADIKLYKEEVAKYLKNIFGDILEKEDLNDIAEIAHDLIGCFVSNEISANCAKIILLEYYGYSTEEILNTVMNEKGERYSKDSIKTIKSRCLRSIRKNCDWLRVS